MNFVWLPAAMADRDELIDYIARENLVAAISQDDHIEKQTNQLIQYPEIGRPGRMQGTRELVIKHTSFVVVYRVNMRAGRIEIWRVLHTSQAWPN